MKIPSQDFALKMQVAYVREGGGGRGVFAGHYGSSKCMLPVFLSPDKSCLGKHCNHKQHGSINDITMNYFERQEIGAQHNQNPHPSN